MKLLILTDDLKYRNSISLVVKELANRFCKFFDVEIIYNKNKSDSGLIRNAMPRKIDDFHRNLFSLSSR